MCLPRFPPVASAARTNSNVGFSIRCPIIKSLDQSAYLPFLKAALLIRQHGIYWLLSSAALGRMDEACHPEMVHTKYPSHRRISLHDSTTHHRKLHNSCHVRADPVVLASPRQQTEQMDQPSFDLDKRRRSYKFMQRCSASSFWLYCLISSHSSSSNTRCASCLPTQSFSPSLLCCVPPQQDAVLHRRRLLTVLLVFAGDCVQLRIRQDRRSG